MDTKNMTLNLDQLKCLLNLQNVARFQTHETISKDNVACHSFRATALYVYFGGTEMLAMFTHDIEESVTGDLPSPIKKYLKGLELFESMRIPFTDKDQETLGKMCDKLDLVIKLQGQFLATGTLPPNLLEIYDAEKEKLLDIASSCSKRAQVKKLLKELSNPLNFYSLMENLEKGMKNEQ